MKLNNPGPLAWLLLGAALNSPAALGFDLQRDDVKAFIAQMKATHDFEQEALERVIGGAERQQRILDLVSKPAEKTKAWHEYRKIFINDDRVDRGVQFYKEHRELLKETERKSGVPAQLIVAILGVETHYGRLTGGFKVIDALTTLAFDYPPRAKFFRSELEEFLLLSREENIQPLDAVGSYAGAMGAPQFISSSYRKFAIDGGGDGRIDLWKDWSDVIGSVGNYFVEHGWRSGEPVLAAAYSDPYRELKPPDGPLALTDSLGGLRSIGLRIVTGQKSDAAAMLFELEGADGPQLWVGFNNFYVITRYNRSTKYAMAVFELSNEIQSKLHDAG